MNTILIWISNYERIIHERFLDSGMNTSKSHIVLNERPVLKVHSRVISDFQFYEN